MGAWHTDSMLGRFGPLALFAAVLIWHSLQYNFITDDAYISFVYARNLAEHGELVYNLGDPVEGFTNFLWTVTLSLALVLGVVPEWSAPILAMVCALGVMVMSQRLLTRISGRPSLWDSLGGALMAVSAGFACWTSGGLETMMFVLWVLWAFDEYLRSQEQPRAFRNLGVALALAAMTRPDGLLVAAVLGAHRLVSNFSLRRRLRPAREELLCVGVFLAVWLPYFAWRWWYYGYPFPNTYYVKAAGETTAAYSSALRGAGWRYLGQWAQHNLVWYLAPFAALACVARPRSLRFEFTSSAILFVAIFAGYTLSVGGDFMGLHRFIMPATVLLLILAAMGLREAASRIPFGAPWLSRGVALALVLAFAFFQWRLTREQTKEGNWASEDGIDTPAFLKVYAQDRATIGKHMRQCFEPDDFSILGGAGAKAYWGHVRGIDVFGLVSSQVAHEVQPTRARPGHNKWAPDSMLLEMKPTFVFSCYSLHRQARKPKWNCRPSFWTQRGYEAVTLHIPGLIERGSYYTFLVRKDRAFECPGTVP